MRLALIFALLVVSTCYDSAWIYRYNITQCPELCTDASDRNCLLSGEYNWTTRNFNVSLKMCLDSDSEQNCFEDSSYGWIADTSQPLQGNISTADVPCMRGVSLESLYDSWEITMRTVYRENAITPIRLYRNTTPEYEALLESTHNNQDSASIIIPYRFIMQYAGTREQAASTALQSVQTLMHLYAIKDMGWWYSFEFEKSGRNQHDVLVFQNGSSNIMLNGCAPGFKQSYQDEREYVCIGEKCGMYPPCTSVNVPPTCTENTFRLLAGPGCRPLPLAGSMCMLLLRYVTGQQQPIGLSRRAAEVIPRIIDLQCAGAADTGMYVLVDALYGDGSEQQALVELLGLWDTSAAAARCCVAALDSDTDTSVCQMCPDAAGGRRRLLAAAATDGQDLSAQWYAVNVSQTSDGTTNASDSTESSSQTLLIALLSTGGGLVFVAVCVYLGFCARKSTSVQPGNPGVEARPLLLYV